MTGLIEGIQRWRMRADELHTAADGMIDEAARDAMLDMTESYDCLANRLAIFHAKGGTAAKLMECPVPDGHPESDAIPRLGLIWINPHSVRRTRSDKGA